MAEDSSRPDAAPPGANEPIPAASEAAEAAAAAKASNPNRTRNIVAGAAIGIGSAALVAALLYARSAKKGDRRDD
jgi:uncharacterized protein involved in exopolysaccharide biosynthesis